MDNIERYDSHKDCWERVEHSMRTARYFLAVRTAPPMIKSFSTNPPAGNTRGCVCDTGVSRS